MAPTQKCAGLAFEVKPKHYFAKLGFTWEVVHAPENDPSNRQFAHLPLADTGVWQGLVKEDFSKSLESAPPSRRQFHSGYRA